MLSPFPFMVLLLTASVEAQNFQFCTEEHLLTTNIPEIWKLCSRWSVPTAISENVSPECKRDSLHYVKALGDFNSWALQMLDASGKLPEGLASGNIHAMGHFDQCLGIQQDNFTGQYCTVFIQPIQVAKETSIFGSFSSSEGIHNASKTVNITNIYAPVTPSIALCIPSTCSSEDVQLAMVDAIGNRTYFGYHLAVATSSSYCITSNGIGTELDIATITMIIALSVIAFLLITGTCLHTWLLCATKSTEGSLTFWADFLLCFSLYKNGLNILDTESSSTSLRCLHGMRFLSMTWVVMGHSWSQNTKEFAANLPTLLQAGYTFSMQTISNSLISVDTFFFLSGLLVAYNTFNQLQKTQKINLLSFYVYRYMRLAPVYAVILGFIATISVHLNSGPTWNTIMFQTSQCRKTWWSNLLFINNFIGPSYSTAFCMAETWYLACDFQLFLISPLLIYPIWRNPRKGLIILSSFVSLSIIACMVQTAVERLPPTIIATRSDILEDTLRYKIGYYTKVWPRIAPYGVGIAIGWALHSCRNSKFEMNPLTVLLGWVVSLVIALVILYGMYGCADPRKEPSISSSISVSYSALHKLGWAVALGWLTWACTNGYGGFVNTFLSWKGFVPVSRLTYCTYLIHLNWIIFFYARSRRPMYYTTIDQIFNYMGHLTISLLLAFVACICVEAPFLNLQKLFFPTKK